MRPETQADFVAGDSRVNEHPFLTAMHVIMMREHNRIAQQLKRHLPPDLRTDEIIYQESRRIVISEIQNVVYGEYLPAILGKKYMDKYDLFIAEKTKYNPDIINEILLFHIRKITLFTQEILKYLTWSGVKFWGCWLA